MINKKIAIISISLLSVAAFASAIFSQSNKNILKMMANDNVIYYHYNEVSPTGTRHGSREFWMNCSTLTPVYDEPTTGTIYQGAAFDTLDAFFDLTPEDGRYIPPTTATPSVSGNTVIYGIYPQQVLNDASLTSTLESSAVLQSNGWYKYKAEYYAKATGNPYSTATFDDGRTITKDATYWFKCQPISWKCIRNSGSQLMLVSNTLLDTTSFYHVTTNTTRTIDGKSVHNNNYKYSDLRPFLNEDFFNCAFVFGSSAIETTEVDNSKNSTNATSYVCDNTFDKVFALSYSELRDSTLGFSTADDRTCLISDYTRTKRGQYNTTTKCGYYWTRSPETDGMQVRSYLVYANGSLYGVSPSQAYDSIRPGINITIS